MVYRMGKRKEEEMKDNWYEEFTNCVIAKRKEKGATYNKKEEKEAREYLDSMMHILSGYRLKCAIRTLIEIDDLMEELDDSEGIE